MKKTVTVGEYDRKMQDFHTCMYGNVTMKLLCVISSQYKTF
jgi:hypothetical protein